MMIFFILSKEISLIMKRRDYLKHFGYTSLGSLFIDHRILSRTPKNTLNKTPQEATIFDAMGEVRNVYSKELLKQMLKSGLNGITVTLCDPKTFEQEATQAAMDGILYYDRYIEKHPDLLLKATSIKDLEQAKQEGKLAIFYLFQNSTQFGRILDSVDIYYGLGVRSSQITYNFQNWAGAGCKDISGAGLSDYGHALVQKMNEVKMLVDLSHANMKTMSDTIKASKVPVIISHTACMSVYENIRNTTDENMRLIAKYGGLVGICQIRPFVSNLREGSFEHYLDHIEYAVKVAGIDHVCIGSDRDHRVIEWSEEYLAELAAEEGANFHAEDWPLFMDELNGPTRNEKIWYSLKSRGFSDDHVEKIMGTNVVRLYKEVVG